MICPHCSRSIKVAQITEQRGKGFAAQIRCYHCDAWVGKSARLAKVKMVSFYLGLAVGIYAVIEPNSRHLMIPIAIFAVMILLVSHFMDHPYTVEAPEKPDDSEHLKKYR